MTQKVYECDHPPTAKIPVYFESDREVLEKAVASLATGTPERLRIVRIVNTLEMAQLLVSEALGEEVRGQGYLSVRGRGPGRWRSMNREASSALLAAGRAFERTVCGCGGATLTFSS
jgi:hypothetical protein